MAPTCLPPMPVTALIWVFLKFWEFETKANSVCTKISMAQRERLLTHPRHLTLPTSSRRAPSFSDSPSGGLRSGRRGHPGRSPPRAPAPQLCGEALDPAALLTAQAGAPPLVKRAERSPGPAPPHGAPVRTPRPACTHAAPAPPEHRGLDRRILCTGCYS